MKEKGQVDKAGIKDVWMCVPVCACEGRLTHRVVIWQKMAWPKGCDHKTIMRMRLLNISFQMFSPICYYNTLYSSGKAFH